MTQLEILRRSLDEVDAQMVSLFEARMALSRQIALYKHENGLPVLDASREEAVITSRAAMLKDPSLDESLKAFYHTLMALSRNEQQRLIQKEG